MKFAAIMVLLGLSTVSLAAPKTTQCVMHSRGNEATVILVADGSNISVQMGDAEPDQCISEANSSYSIHARCGADDDAMYFGVKGSSGKVYASFGTVATLKSCKTL